MLVDANLLLYAVISDYPQHLRAKAWLESQFNGSVRVTIPWQNLLAFVRISTNINLFSRPLSVSFAWQYVESWIALPNVWVPQPQNKHQLILGELLIQTNSSGNLVSDAHLAAGCFYTDYSLDSGFVEVSRV